MHTQQVRDRYKEVRATNKIPNSYWGTPTEMARTPAGIHTRIYISGEHGGPKGREEAEAMGDPDGGATPKEK